MAPPPPRRIPTHDHSAFNQGGPVKGNTSGNTSYSPHPSLTEHDALGLATDADLSTHAAAADPHTGYQKESEKGAANGYASLGAGGLVPIAQLASGTPDGTKFVRDDGTLVVPAGSALTVEEVDGTPTVSATKLVLPNGTLGVVGTVATYTPAAGAGAIAESLIDAKGDLIVGSADNTAARLAVGATNGHVLTVDSAQALGVKWAAGGGTYTPATAPAIVQGVGSTGLNTQNPTLTIAAAASGHTLLLGVNLVGRASTSVTCTNVTWTKVAGPTTSSGGSRYETWVGTVAGGASGTTITVNTGSSNYASLVVIEIANTITVSAGTPYDSDFLNISFGPLAAPTAGKLIVMMVGVDNTTTGILVIPQAPMHGFSRSGAGTGVAIFCGFSNGDDVTGILWGASGTVFHAQIVAVT